MGHSGTTYNSALVDAVRNGLNRRPRNLPSWLFYDEFGDQLFREIMRIPEYYPTRCEYDILEKNRETLLQYFSPKNEPFRLIELGAGDGLKTELLLRHFVDRGAHFTYVPVDISGNTLDILTERLGNTLPGLAIEPLNHSYDTALQQLHRTEERKAILFLGANIGNFTVEEAAKFLRNLARPLRRDDLVLIGVDLKKDPRIILEAYDDPGGLTASFNLNILMRLNRELGADFNPEHFAHFPSYDPETGAAKSFLVSTRDQSVHIEALGKSFSFGQWETIQTEVSQKYDMAMIEKMTAVTGLRIVDTFFDDDHYFCDLLLSTQ